MKRIIALLLLTVLLTATLAVPVMAAGCYYLVGPKEIHIGETITVTFYGGALQNGVYEGKGTFVYNNKQVTLIEYTPLLGEPWQVDFFGDTFHFWQKTQSEPLRENVPIFSATFRINENLYLGEYVRFAAENVSMNDGVTNIPLENDDWWWPVQEPLSANSNLYSLTVEGFMISPKFSADTLNYAVYLPNEVEALQVKAQPEDYRAAVTLPDFSNIPVGSTTYGIPVTAENGDVKTYTLTVYRAEPVGAVDQTEPPEETTVPTTEATEPVTEPATEPTPETTTPPEKAPAQEPVTGGLSKGWMAVLWITSLVAAFIGGFITPMLIFPRD